MRLDDFEDWIPEDEELEDEDLDDEPQEDGKGMEGGAARPLSMALVCVGLIASAATICAILWNVTHSDRKERDINGPVENTVEDQTAKSSQGTKPGEDSGPETGTEPGEDSGPDTGTEPGEDFGPDTGTEPGEDSGPGNGTAAVPPTAGGEQTEASASEGTALEAMVFEECRDTVTPKDVINLRTAPDTGQTDNIVAQAVNGEQLERTGVNRDTGWSRLEYGGQTLYAVSSYLTTDLGYQPPAAVSDPNSVITKDGRTITFIDCDDTVTPKMYVNLRLEPSTSEGNDTIHCRLEYGEEVHRTGISEESGWSRVEYDGHVLYVVTSYIYVVEEQ